MCPECRYWLDKLADFAILVGLKILRRLSASFALSLTYTGAHHNLIGAQSVPLAFAVGLLGRGDLV